MIKPFDMSEVGLLVEQAENSTFSGYMKQIAAERAAKEATEKEEIVTEEKKDEIEKGGEEAAADFGGESSDEGSDEGSEKEDEDDEDLEQAKEAVMNIVSLSKKELEKLEASDPDLYEELEAFAKKVCKYEEKEEDKED